MLGWRLEVMVVRLTSVAQCWGWSEQNPRTGKCKIDFGTRMPCRPGYAIQRHRHRRLYTCLYNAHENATHEQEQTIQWHSKSNTVKMYDSNDILHIMQSVWYKICTAIYTMQMLFKAYALVGVNKAAYNGWRSNAQCKCRPRYATEGRGKGQLTVACFLYFMQFNLYTPTGCLHRKPNNTHIYKNVWKKLWDTT